MNKLLELHDQLYSYHNDIACVTETFLHSGISNGLLDPKQLYTIIRKDCSSGKGGGVCSFMNQNILICQLPLPEIYADLEMLCFDIVKLVPPVRYFLVYRPPYSDECAVPYAFCRRVLGTAYCYQRYKCHCGRFQSPKD